MIDSFQNLFLTLYISLRKDQFNKPVFSNNIRGNDSQSMHLPKFLNEKEQTKVVLNYKKHFTAYALLHINVTAEKI